MLVTVKATKHFDPGSTDDAICRNICGRKT